MACGRGWSAAVALLLLAVVSCCCQPACCRDVLRAGSGSGRARLVRRSAHFCGSELISVLQMICGSAGVSGASGKRTATVAMADFQERRLNSIEEERSRLPGGGSAGDRQRLLQALDPLSGRQQQQQQPPGRRQSRQAGRYRAPHRVRVKRQGIVEECCYNACSTSTLRSYCNYSD